VHIDEYEIEVADTKLGPEQTTNDIPWVALMKLKNLDEEGIIRIGSTVKWSDLLVGKISPKSEGELSPEEKLIQAIFGDKSKSFKDSSLYLPAGSEWKIIDVVTLDAKKWDNLSAWVRRKIKVYVAATRQIEVWDKLAGRHGNKGIIATVVPEEDMPFSEDWTPIDIILNPLGVISRMNIGQTYETQLWLVAKALGKKFAVPLFADFGQDELGKLMVSAWFNKDGKMKLIDGRTWEAYDGRVTVWYMYVLKLIHMVEDKIHARSVGPYSLITQQPLWGKARQWWQRFGEMEVWALEAYSAVYTLQEMLTIKSDDVTWRNKAYEAIIKWWEIKVAWLPESFNLVVYLFKGLGQSIVPMSQDEIDSMHAQRIQKITDLWLKWITGGDIIDKSEVASRMKTEDELEEKQEIMNSVVQELKEHWDIDE
jgi:DNA-directed RNA polymerase subunit beta